MSHAVVYAGAWGVKYVARCCLRLNRYGKEYREHHAFLQTTVLENSIPSIPSIPRTHRVYSTAQTLRVPHREVCPAPRAKVGRLLTARVPHKKQGGSPFGKPHA